MEKMLVTQGLNELKLLNDRINKKISSGEFVSSAKKTSKNVKGKKDRTQFITDAKSDYNSVLDLIKRRNAIKSAIVKSNATTVVDVAGVGMTVAEAIERKESIMYERFLLNELKTQFSKETTVVVKENAKVDEAVNQLLITAYGKDTKDKVSETMYSAIATPYREANEFELITGFDVEKAIKDLEENIDNFLSNVDTVLQVSNSTTFIEF